MAAAGKMVDKAVSKAGQTASKVGGALGFDTKASRTAATKARLNDMRKQGQDIAGKAGHAKSYVEGMRKAGRGALKKMDKQGVNAASQELARRNKRNLVVGGTAAAVGGGGAAIYASRSGSKDKAARIASETK